MEASKISKGDRLAYRPRKYGVAYEVEVRQKLHIRVTSINKYDLIRQLRAQYDAKRVSLYQGKTHYLVSVVGTGTDGVISGDLRICPSIQLVEPWAAYKATQDRYKLERQGIDQEWQTNEVRRQAAADFFRSMGLESATACHDHRGMSVSFNLETLQEILLQAVEA